MKKLNKEVLVLILFLFLVSVAGIYFGYVIVNQQKEEAKSVVLIGWDGAHREHVYDMLEKNQLPNLKELITEGGIVDINISTGSTHTKPGWAEILTGYRSEAMGIYNNKDYKPIPQGYTIFERLEDYFGKENIVTVFIGGKINNIGARGSHKICINCLTRDEVTREKTEWWREDTQAPPRIAGEERIFEEREGEPYFYTKDALDVYETALGEASNVGPRVLESLEKTKDKLFFSFFHFEEPDELGHKYGENSEEYSQGIVTDDYWLGEIVAKLKKLNLYEKTIIYVVADHGFDEGRKSHNNAPYVFLATNGLQLKNGDRKDITPTILDVLGIDLSAIEPPLDGESLLR